MQPAEPDGESPVLAVADGSWELGPTETLYLKHPFLARSSAFLRPVQMAVKLSDAAVAGVEKRWVSGS